MKPSSAWRWPWWSAPCLGVERERLDRPAGLRTYMLVVEGACLFMICAILLAEQITRAGGVSDPGRIASTVVQGIGFIAAGVILTTGKEVIGLTTAAGLWVATALGLLIGAGFYVVAVVAAVATVVALIALRGVELRFLGSKSDRRSRFVRVTLAVRSHWLSAKPVFFQRAQSIRVELRTFVVTGGGPLPKCLVQADSARNGDVQALHHTGHRDLDCTVGHVSRLCGDPSHLIAKDQRDWHSEIPVIEWASIRADARDQNGETFRSQALVAVGKRRVSLDLHPFCRARRRLPCKRAGRRFFDAVDRVRPQHADPIARAENGADVVRVVDVFQHDRQIWLPPREHGPDARLPTLGSRPAPRFERLRPG